MYKIVREKFINIHTIRIVRIGSERQLKMSKEEYEKIRATFLIPRDEWEIFKLICARYTCSWGGKERTCTASDELREHILIFIQNEQNRKHLQSLIEYYEENKPNSPLLHSLKELRGDFIEDDETK
jgi:hypothetical protein